MSANAIGSGSRSGQIAKLAMLMLLGAALLGGAGCSVDRRSSAFACESTTECSGSRVCVDQFCVLPGTAGTCPLDCTRCEGGTCYLDCTDQDCTGFDCPAGWKCNITCGTGRCTNIDCGSSDCDLLCTGNNACEDITCGTGRCNVLCTGRRACADVECQDACSCQVACDGLLSCNGVSCPGGCSAENNGCSATTPATCNTCP